ncbi:Protein of unknown function [Pyronema omphalodes CBS 100304]|uniref:Uncharacterized protein n=1 Tax=Pyronema omphalodes (strain CBS 100304) TaxID=1076935 RepID=U4LDM3_PYROM|nr:Protein of unknown function [Pyronema omphalodes CBS 100304]
MSVSCSPTREEKSSVSPRLRPTRSAWPDSDSRSKHLSYDSPGSDDGGLKILVGGKLVRLWMQWYADKLLEGYKKALSTFFEI